MYLGCTEISATSSKIRPQKNENGAQKNLHIFKRKCTYIAETWYRLRSDVYQGLDFFRSLCVLSSWNKTTCKSFVAKVTKCNGPFKQKRMTLNYV